MVSINISMNLPLPRCLYHLGKLGIISYYILGDRMQLIYDKLKLISLCISIRHRETDGNLELGPKIEFTRTC